MFNENDKYLHIYYTMNKILMVLSAVVGVILTIVFAVIYHPIALLFLLVIPIVCIVWWIVFKLFISYLVDIKLIRNKLYENGNTKAKEYFKEPRVDNNINVNQSEVEEKESSVDDLETEQEEEDEEGEENMQGELFRAYNKFASGAINKETYDKLTKRIIEKYNKDTDDSLI